MDEEELRKLPPEQQEAEMLKYIMQKAFTEENSKFTFIVSWQHRKAVKEYLQGMKQLVKTFNLKADMLEREYLEQILTDTQDVNLLTALVQILHCRDYYQREVDVVKDMLDEYRCYIHSGHLINTLLGIPRPKSDFIDYRTLPLF